MEGGYDKTAKRLSFGDSSVHSTPNMIEVWPDHVGTISLQRDRNGRRLDSNTFVNPTSPLRRDLDKMVAALTEWKRYISVDINSKEYTEFKRRQAQANFSSCKFETVEDWTKEFFLRVLLDEEEDKEDDRRDVNVKKQRGLHKRENTPGSLTRRSPSSSLSAWSSDADSAKKEAAADKAGLHQVKARNAAIQEEVTALIDEVALAHDILEEDFRSIGDELQDMEAEVANLRSLRRRNNFAKMSEEQEGSQDLARLREEVQALSSEADEDLKKIEFFQKRCEALDSQEKDLLMGMELDRAKLAAAESTLESCGMDEILRFQQLTDLLAHVQIQASAPNNAL